MKVNKNFFTKKKNRVRIIDIFQNQIYQKLKLHEGFDLEKLKKELPELPEAKRARYKKDFGIKDEDIEVYINDIKLGAWFEEVAKILNDKEKKIKIASNYITTDFIGIKIVNLAAKPAKFKEFF